MGGALAATVATFAAYACLGPFAYAMTATVPLAVLGLVRYLVVVRRAGWRIHTVDAFWADLPLQIVTVLWALAAAWVVLATSR